MPLRLRRARRLAITLTATGAVAVTAAGPAAGKPPVGAFFDCYSSTSLGLTHIQSIELKSSSVYLVSGFRKGRHLTGTPARGRYRARGNLITWLSGAYAGYRGRYVPRSGQGRARIDILRKNGDSFGVSCEQA